MWIEEPELVAEGKTSLVLKWVGLALPKGCNLKVNQG